MLNALGLLKLCSVVNFLEAGSLPQVVEDDRHLSLLMDAELGWVE